MKPQQLTQSEFKLYTVIVNSKDAYRGPTLPELAKRSGWTRDWITQLVKGLKTKGWINENNYPIKKTAGELRTR